MKATKEIALIAPLLRFQLALVLALVLEMLAGRYDPGRRQKRLRSLDGAVQAVKPSFDGSSL